MSSNKFGYVGYQNNPEQAYGSNSGIFSMNEIYDLDLQDKWTQLGALELIQTQTFSGSNSIQFTDLKDYSRHFLTFSFGIGSVQDVTVFLNMSSDGGSSYETTGNQYAQRYGQENGTYNQATNNNLYGIQIVQSVTTNTGGANGFVWLYNLKFANKYSMTSQHATSLGSGSRGYRMEYGNGMSSTLTSHNAIQLYPNTQTLNGRASLYGLREGS